MKKPRKLTDHEKDSVRAWLKLNMSVLCPFNIVMASWDINHKDWHACEEVCQARFPRCEAKKQCPCGNYTKETVVRRARAMLEE